MRRQAVLDALAHAEFLPWVIQPDSGAFDGVDPWQCLLPGCDVGIVDAVRALQTAIGSDNRHDQGGIAPDQPVLVVVVRAAPVSANDGGSSADAAAGQVGIG